MDPHTRTMFDAILAAANEHTVARIGPGPGAELTYENMTEAGRAYYTRLAEAAIEVKLDTRGDLMLRKQELLGAIDLLRRVHPTIGDEHLADEVRVYMGAMSDEPA